MMVTRKTGSLCKRLIFSGVTGALLGSNASALEYKLDKHQLDLGFRGRLATVEASQNARAASVLLRLKATSHWASQVSTLFEVDHVALGFEDDFSNGENFNDAPVIPDVAGTDLNQALIRYSPTNTIDLSLGREAIEFGNARFVGANNFWQNEQTLDGFGFNYAFATASSVSYAFVDNANRINGDDAGRRLSPNDSNFEQNNGLRPAPFLGDHDHNTHLVFAQFKEWDFSRVQAYFFDIDIKDAAVLSNQTLGARYEYRGRLGRIRTAAHAELAVQERPKANDSAALLYHDLGAGFGVGSSEISINYERLGENDGTSFVTPLASLHDHNGWADQFLLTPSGGLRDFSIQYIWRDSPWQIDARYHLFNSDSTNDHLGAELDIDFSIQVNRDNTLLLRLADFTASANGYADERRIFLMFIHNL